jgi:phosphoglycolate phosphatase
VVVIGDTPADISCGRALGARAIAVATGSYSVDELKAHHPYAVFQDLSDTDAVMAAIAG